MVLMAKYQILCLVYRWTYFKMVASFFDFFLNKKNRQLFKLVGFVKLSTIS